MVQKYQNILNEFRKERSDFLWISRDIQFKETYNQDRPHLSPLDFKQLVIDNNHVQDAIRKICKETSKDCEKADIYNILNEIAFDYDLPVIRWLGYVLVKILRNSLSGLYVNEEKLSMIKNDMGHSPVIFLPTHRSYGDFILMAFICFKYEISIPCVAAGMDFLSMKFMNKILRKSKAFFLRRRFADDPIYRTIFVEYIKVIISFQRAPVEFFIEGTRSRTGKSLPPKFGLLTMLAEAYMSGDIPDLKIIPVNISYDRILEERLFAHELMGIPKPKETTKGLIHGIKVMKGNYGNVFICFGDPLSIRDYFHESEDLRYFPLEYGNIKVKKLANEIVKRQQQLQTFSCFNLLALIFNRKIYQSKSYKVPLVDAAVELRWLIPLFEKFGANIHLEGDLEQSIKKSVLVHSSLVELTEGDLISLKTEEPSKEYLNACVPFFMLQIYINPSLNLFGRASIIINILNQINAQRSTTVDDLFQNYLYMCSIFKYEFVLDGQNKEDFSNCLSLLRKLEITDMFNSQIKLLPQSTLTWFLKDLVTPFIVGLHLICLFITNFQDRMYQRKLADVITMIQRHIEDQIKSCKIQFHYCSSVDFINNSLNSLHDMGVIRKNEKGELYKFETRSLMALTKYLRCLSQKNDHLESHKKDINKEILRPKL